MSTYKEEFWVFEDWFSVSGIDFSISDIFTGWALANCTYLLHPSNACLIIIYGNVTIILM
jgi:hypothetical protein